MKSCERIIHEYERRGLFFGVAFYPHSGTGLYLLVNGRIRYVTMGVAKAHLKEIKRREDEESWQSFGLTAAYA